MKPKNTAPRASSAGIHSRRHFLKSTALAGAAAFAPPLVVPASALGSDSTVAASNRITLGFIGAGRQAAYANIPGFLHQPDAQVVAVCDVDCWRLARAQKQVEDVLCSRPGSGKWQGCAAFPDWRELIARKDIDAVMISTPDHWHMVMAIAALKAGKDVSCEKPLTRNIAEGRKLVETVRQTERVFCTDSEFRTYRWCQHAAELVRNGKIGKLQRILTGTPKDPTLAAQPAMPVPEELDYEMWLGPAPQQPYTEKRVHPRSDDKGRPGWLCIRDYADGMMANWGAHLNDIAMWANNTEHTGPVGDRSQRHLPAKGQPLGRRAGLRVEFHVRQWCHAHLQERQTVYPVRGHRRVDSPGLSHSHRSPPRGTAHLETRPQRHPTAPHDQRKAGFPGCGEKSANNRSTMLKEATAMPRSHIWRWHPLNSTAN